MAGTIFLGLVLIVVGFFAVWKSYVFEEYIGNLAELMSSPQWSWLSWKLLGVVFMFLGAIMVFGLLPLVFGRLFGNFFHIEF